MTSMWDADIYHIKTNNSDGLVNPDGSDKGMVGAIYLYNYRNITVDDKLHCVHKDTMTYEVCFEFENGDPL